MRRSAISIALMAVLAITSVAEAGEKCTYDAQTCLDYFVREGKTGWAGLDGNMTEHGYEVTKVTSGAPAEKAGIQVGDVLTKLNGVWKDDAKFQQVYKESMKPGNTVTFTFLRGKHEKTAKVTLAEMPHEVFAVMVGRHMLLHADTYPPSKKK